jgi:hypothetical protein
LSYSLPEKNRKTKAVSSHRTPNDGNQMMRSTCLCVLLLAGDVRAQDSSLPEVAQMIKPFLVKAIPPVLYEHNRNWGKTSRVPHAVHWHGLRPEVHSTPRNDGHWQKIRLTPRQLAGTLDFRMSPPKKIDDDRQSFQVYLTFVTGIEYEHQLWESGVRLYSGSTRARARIHLKMDVENTMRWDKTNYFLPDLVVRLRATNAKLAYNELVVEHTAGVGGSAAKLIGEAIEGLIREIEPDLERRLLDKAGAAIVRAADTREIRLGLGSILK